MQTWMPQVKKGMIEFWVAAALGHGESYGYELMLELTEKSGEAVSEGAIYPLLARLTRDGLTTTRIGGSPAGPQRRYYTLTPLGRARLKRMADYWKRLQRTSERILRGDKSRPYPGTS